MSGGKITTHAGDELRFIWGKSADPINVRQTTAIDCFATYYCP
jgi:hypothetical protein